MHATYTYPRYPYRRPPEIGAAPRRLPLVVIGAGPVGLAAAIDLAQRGQPVVLLDDDDTVSLGSRGLCHAQRTLQIFDRLGIGDQVVAKGVTWNVGRTFHREAEVFRFDLLPEPGHRRPGMVNLQQYWLEQFLVERAAQLPSLDLRWQHRVVGVTPQAAGARIEVETADGSYTLDADWLVVADGVRSPVRRLLGFESAGRVFEERFLIADVVLDAELFPADRTERWFWFDPPFHPGQSVLLHREADGVWRVDFQLGPDADPEAEREPARVVPRIRALLDRQGHGHLGFTLEWVSVYSFRCRRMARFRHGRVLFAGDAAHQVSPFGARGGNSGVQDADNLGWKLDLVLRGAAPERLLDSYCSERRAAADENIRASSRSTDFMTPKSHAAETLRRAVLTLAHEHPFARTLVDSGRLSVASVLADSPLVTPDRDQGDDAFAGWMVPGAPMDDAPVDAGANGQDMADADGDADADTNANANAEVDDAAEGSVNADAGSDSGEPSQWLLGHLQGGFTLLVFADAARPLSESTAAALHALRDGPVPIEPLLIVPRGEHRSAVAVSAAARSITCLEDRDGLVHARCDARAGTGYLLRPDQHVAARWRRFDPAMVRAALVRAIGAGETHASAKGIVERDNEIDPAPPDPRP